VFLTLATDSVTLRPVSAAQLVTALRADAVTAVTGSKINVNL
jgi:hypothetical protein